MSRRKQAPNQSVDGATFIEDEIEDGQNSSDYVSNTISTPEATQVTSQTNKNSNPTIVLEVSAAYNRDALPLPRPNGPNGRRILNLEMLMNHPLYWDFLNERETEEVLMELYIARTRRMQ